MKRHVGYLALLVSASLSMTALTPAAQSGRTQRTAETALQEAEKTQTGDRVYDAGSYSFTWSGGSGRINISCSSLEEKNGQNYATLIFTNNSGRPASFDQVKVDGQLYEGSNSFTIPVRLNQDMSVEGRTTAMSEPHWITYMIRIDTAGTSADWDRLDDQAPEIEGLKAQGEMKIIYSDRLKIFSYEDGYRLVEEDLGEQPASAAGTEGSEEATPYDTQVLRCLIVPEDEETPENLNPRFMVIRQPVSSVYVTSAEALGILEKLNALSTVSLTGLQEKDLTSDAVKQAIEAGTISNTGTYDSWDLKSMVLKKTGLVIEDADILPEGTEDEAGQAAAEESVQSALQLNIPMIIDLSSREDNEPARAEWIRFYGAVFGREDEAEKLCRQFSFTGRTDSSCGLS